MTRIACLTILCLFITASPAEAGSIVYRATGQLSHIAGSGADALGLDQATFVFKATFDDSATYESYVGGVRVLAESASLTITRQSSPGLSIEHPADLYLIPNVKRQFHNLVINPPSWLIEPSQPGDREVQLLNFVGSVTGVAPGDRISLSHFSTVLADPNEVHFHQKTVETPQPEWQITGFSASVSQVPEPSSLALLGLGLCGVVGVRRRGSRRKFRRTEQVG